MLDQKQAVVYANDRFRKLFQAVRQQELEVGRSYIEQARREDEHCLLIDLLEHRKVESHCCEVELEDGVRYFQIHLSSFGPQGQYQLVQLEDVTERKRAERRALAAQQGLREAMRTRDVILSIIGHDLRSPIAQLNAILYLLKQTPGTLSIEKLQAYSAELEDMTRHLSSALDNLLHWSTSHRRGLDPKWETVDPGQVMSESVGLLHPLALHKQIFLAIDNSITSRIETDREMLAFIMRNLLANAVKFTPAAGRIQLRQWQDQSSFYFEVKDSGVGMDADQLKEIRRTDSFLSTRGTAGERGVGLGLKLCLEFTEKLGGRLHFESEVGKGTAVRFTIPLRHITPELDPTDDEA